MTTVEALNKNIRMLEVMRFASELDLDVQLWDRYIWDDYSEVAIIAEILCISTGKIVCSYRFDSSEGADSIAETLEDLLMFVRSH